MLLTDTISRLLTAPDRTFFLFGPRGTGKSTWLRATYPQATRFDLLDEGLYQDLLVRPELFGELLQRERAGGWVVVDEVQRLPNLLNEVHRFAEERRLKFALSGSSTRKLKRAGVNLLGGRAHRVTMYPFLPLELGRRFELDDALRFGTLPVVLSSPTPEKTLSAYAQLYLREEIQAEALARNIPGFARFLTVAALFHGQVLNTSSLARDAGVQRTTVNDYLEILEDTLMAWRVPAFEARLRARERRHPKLYWVDPGLVRAAKKQLGEVAIEEQGALFEGLVGMCLRAHAELAGGFDELTYWASASHEVDFLLKRGPALVAIEAKTSTRLRDEDLAGLRAIAALPRLRRRLLVYRGPRALRTADGIEVVPFAELMRELEAGTLMKPRG